MAKAIIYDDFEGSAPGWAMDWKDGNYVIYHESNPSNKIKIGKFDNDTDAEVEAEKIIQGFKYTSEKPHTPIFPAKTEGGKQRQRLEYQSYIDPKQTGEYPGSSQAVADSTAQYKKIGPQYKPQHVKDAEIEKALNKDGDLTENEKRLIRLQEQPKDWVGTIQAEQDSAKVEGDIPRFTTAATKAKKAKEDAEDYNTKLTKARGEYRKQQDIIDLNQIIIDSYPATKRQMMPEEITKIKQAEKKIEIAKRKMKNIGNKYPEIDSNPLGLDIK
jgi:hypothetical protein